MNSSKQVVTTILSLPAIKLLLARTLQRGPSGEKWFATALKATSLSRAFQLCLWSLDSGAEDDGLDLHALETAAGLKDAKIACGDSEDALEKLETEDKTVAKILLRNFWGI